MKKIVMLIAALCICAGGFAQRIAHVHPTAVNAVGSNGSSRLSSRTTATGDTVILSNILAGPSTTIYSLGADSGYVTGTDYYGDQAFAERFDFNGQDSTLQVIGVMALFSGNVNPASTKTINLNIWNVGIIQLVTASEYYSGFPDTLLNTLSEPVTQIGIGTTADTLKSYMFAAPTGYLSSSFFAGYSINYNFATLNGDTLGIVNSLNHSRTSTYTLSYNISSFGDTTLDTVLNVQNATMGSDGVWYDNYTQNDSLLNDLAIYPIVVTGAASVSAVKGITRNSLTYYGNYPNPAVNTTNIKFSLAGSTDVTVQVTDMSGRILNTIRQANQGIGEHIITVNTAAMVSGDYLYLIRTASGDGIAGKMTIIH